MGRERWRGDFGLCPNATWDCETTDCAFNNQVRKKQLSAEKV